MNHLNLECKAGERRIQHLGMISIHHDPTDKYVSLSVHIFALPACFLKDGKSNEIGYMHEALYHYFS